MILMMNLTNVPLSSTNFEYTHSTWEFSSFIGPMHQGETLYQLHSGASQKIENFIKMAGTQMVKKKHFLSQVRTNFDRTKCLL